VVPADETIRKSQIAIVGPADNEFGIGQTEVVIFDDDLATFLFVEPFE